MNEAIACSTSIARFSYLRWRGRACNDPGSELERTGRVAGGAYLRPAHERKHDAVDVRGLGDAIKERVAERVKREPPPTACCARAGRGCENQNPKY